MAAAPWRRSQAVPRNRLSAPAAREVLLWTLVIGRTSAHHGMAITRCGDGGGAHDTDDRRGRAEAGSRSAPPAPALAARMTAMISASLGGSAGYGLKSSLAPRSRRPKRLAAWAARS